MRVRLSLLATAAAVALLAALGTSTAAANPLACNGSGQLRAENGSPATWELSGKGSCLDLSVTNSTPREVTLSGVGTSESLGLCTPGGLVVRDLRLDVAMTLKDVNGTGAVNEVWHAPLALFPLATTFLIDDNDGNPKGLSVVFHRIFLRCGNDGRKPSAVFAWVRG